MAMSANAMLTGISCPQCDQGRLGVLRSCGRVRLCCNQCSHQFQIHEVADRLDDRAEEILSRWTCIIYD